MPLMNHVTELERKHQILERQIQDALNHASTDQAALAQLKRKKLQLKDEIMRLRDACASSVH